MLYTVRERTSASVLSSPRIWWVYKRTPNFLTKQMIRDKVDRRWENLVYMHFNKETTTELSLNKATVQR